MASQNPFYEARSPLIANSIDQNWVWELWFVLKVPSNCRNLHWQERGVPNPLMKITCNIRFQFYKEDDLHILFRL